MTRKSGTEQKPPKCERDFDDDREFRLPELAGMESAAVARAHEGAARVVASIYSSVERRRQIEAMVLLEERADIAHTLRVQAARLTGAARGLVDQAAKLTNDAVAGTVLTCAREVAQSALHCYSRADATHRNPDPKRDWVGTAADDLALICKLAGERGASAPEPSTMAEPTPPSAREERTEGST